MGTLLRIVLVVGVLFAVVWLLYEGDRPLVSARKDAKQEIGEATRQAKDALANIDVGAIEKELRETGRVVRRRSAQAARAIGEATEDVRTTAAIEAQFALDPRLSALDIDVNTTDGRVTLAGRVDSASDLARAVELAFQHENVREVISTLQIARPTARVEPAAAPR